MPQGGRLVVTAANGPARDSGIGPGLPLADARALVPTLRVAPTNPAGDARALAALAGLCTRYTPWAAADHPDGLFLDITGCAHLFDGEPALLADLVGRVRGFGFDVRAAAAETAGAAWAVGRFGEPGHSGRPSRTAPRAGPESASCKEGETAAILAPGSVRARLAPLPVASLRLPPTEAEQLGRLGLKRVGDLYDLPRAALAARFGAAVAHRLDQALGHAAEPISPHPPARPDRVRRAFAEPILTREDIAATLDRLLGALCTGLERKGRGARRLALTVERIDGSRAEATIGTSRATRDPVHLERLFAEKLDGLDPGYGIEAMALAAVATDPLPPAQLALAPAGRQPAMDLRIKPEDDSDGCRRSPDPETRPVAPGRDDGTVSKAEVLPFRPTGKPGLRHGSVQPLQSPPQPAPVRLPVPAPHPEQSRRARRRVPDQGVASTDAARDILRHRPISAPDLAALVDRLGNRLGAENLFRHAPRESHLPERAAVRHPAVPTDDKDATGWFWLGPRPLRLLDPPEPVEATAPVPDDPPIMFRWRKVLHRVARADGPERIAPEWWRTAAGGTAVPPSRPHPKGGAADSAPPGSAAADTRDYYRVEDTEGRRFWLYRRGLYRPGSMPCWFLHGIFA